MSSTSPDWMPADIREHTTVVGERHVRVNAHYLDAHVCFGEVPAEWIIELHRPGDKIPQALAVDSTGRGVRWRFDSPGTHRIALAPEMRRVELGTPMPHRGRGPRKAHVAIKAGSHRLYFESGEFQVQADEPGNQRRPHPPSFEAYVTSGGSAAQVVLRGDAVIRKLSGEGDVTVRSPVKDARIELEGNLEIAGPLVGTTVTVSDRLKVGRLEAREVSGRSIVVGPDESSDRPAVWHVRVLRAEEITVSGTVVGAKNQPTELHVSRTASLGGVRHVIFHGKSSAEEGLHPEEPTEEDSTDQSLPTFEVKGECSDLRSVGWFGDCRLGDVLGPIAISRVRRLNTGRVHGAQLALNAREELRSKELRASGEMSAPTIQIERDAVAEGGELVLSASQELRIGHTAKGLIIRCQDDLEEAKVTIGDAGWRSVSFTEPVVSPEQVTVCAVQSRHIRRGHPKLDPVQDCVILSSGHVRIHTGIVASVMWVEGRVEIKGCVDLAALNPMEPETGTDPQDPDGWLRRAHQRPVYGGQIWIEGEVRLNSEQTVEFGSSFSCAAIRGGRVISSVSESLIAIGSTEDAKLRAAKVGVVTEMASTTLQSWELVHVLGPVDEGSRVSVSGDGEFSGVVDGKVRWTAQPGRKFRAVEKFRNLRIRAANPPQEDVEVPGWPRLSGGPAFKVGPLHVGSSARFAIESDRVASGPRHGGVDPRGFCESLYLKEGAEVAFEAGTFDLGVIEVAGDARLTQLASSKSLLALKLSRVAKPHLLRLASEGTVRIEQGTEEQLSLFEEQGDIPCLWVERGRCEVLAALNEVGLGDPELVGSSIERMRDIVPELVVEGAGRISQLAGWFHLVRLEGRIQGAERNSAPERAVPYSQLPRPAKLSKASLEETSEDQRSGHLVGIDASALPFQDIGSMRRVHWFEPDGATLKKYATTSMDEARARDRAQKLRLLAEVAQATAAPGSSRAAVMWAAARAHHAVVPTWPEWLARWVLWLVGYGWRPRPALLTLVGWTLLLTGLLLAFDSRPECAASPSDFIQGPYGFGQQLVRVLSLPAGLLRLDPGGAMTYAPIGCSTGWHLLAFGVTGFFLGSTVLAIRNYLRTPVDR